MISSSVDEGDVLWWDLCNAGTSADTIRLSSACSALWYSAKFN